MSELHEKCFEIALDTINHIDDYLEYRYRHSTKEEVRDFIIDAIDVGAERMKKVNRNE